MNGAYSNGNSFGVDDREVATLPWLFRVRMGIPVTNVTGA